MSTQGEPRGTFYLSPAEAEALDVICATFKVNRQAAVRHLIDIGADLSVPPVPPPGRGHGKRGAVKIVLPMRRYSARLEALGRRLRPDLRRVAKVGLRALVAYAGTLDVAQLCGSSTTSSASVVASGGGKSHAMPAVAQVSSLAGSPSGGS